MRRIAPVHLDSSCLNPPARFAATATIHISDLKEALAGAGMPKPLSGAGPSQNLLQPAAEESAYSQCQESIYQHNDETYKQCLLYNKEGGKSICK